MAQGLCQVGDIWQYSENRWKTAYECWNHTTHGVDDASLKIMHSVVPQSWYEILLLGRQPLEIGEWITSTVADMDQEGEPMLAPSRTLATVVGTSSRWS